MDEKKIEETINEFLEFMQDFTKTKHKEGIDFKDYSFALAAMAVELLSIHLGVIKLITTDFKPEEAIKPIVDDALLTFKRREKEIEKRKVANDK